MAEPLLREPDEEAKKDSLAAKQQSTIKPQTLIAIGAFVVSLLSLWYAHKAYRLNLDTSRSVMDIKVELLNDWDFDSKAGSGQMPLKIAITLQNNGKSVIRGILMGLTPSFCYQSANVDTKTGEHLKPCLAAGVKALFADDIGPSASREYKLDLDTKVLATFALSHKDFLGKISELRLSPRIHYVETRGHVTSFCTSAKADKKGIIPKGIVYPCAVSGGGSGIIGTEEYSLEEYSLDEK